MFEKLAASVISNELFKLYDTVFPKYLRVLIDSLDFDVIYIYFAIIFIVQEFHKFNKQIKLFNGIYFQTNIS